MIRKLVLGTFLYVAFGLPVSGHEFLSDANTPSARHSAKRSVCYLTADRRLRLLQYTEAPVEQNASKELGLTPMQTATARIEPARVDRHPRNRVSLMVGIAY
jgi:hypothetical protein